VSSDAPNARLNPDRTPFDISLLGLAGEPAMASRANPQWPIVMP
jgi:hypothetical protein